jgi:hypothetical protein
VAIGPGRQLRIEAGTTGDSLVACLRAILDLYDIRAPEAELAKLTGLGAEGIDPQHRHELVERAARHFGLELRGLHPPSVAPLRTPPEFAAHFRDSYMPFIRQSLDHGKSVLAWKGWPAPHENDWGLIVMCDQGSCLGITLNCRAPVVLELPPVQVFLVVTCFRPNQGSI